MAEQYLSSSTDIPSALRVNKESNSLDTPDANYLISRSLSNKLNVSAMTSAPSINSTLSAASSTGSLTIYCIETGSIAQSVRRRQSLTNTTVLSNNIEITTTSADEGRLLNDNDKPQELLADVEKTATVSDGDNVSFDDDDETIIDYSLYPQSFPTPPNYVSSPCPICLEQAVLQVSPCCYFLCCNSCWRAHISSTISDGRIKIPCVSNECNKYLTRESIVNFVRYDPPLHERYLKLYLNANQNPRAKTCPRCCHLYSLDTTKSIPLEKTKKKTNKKIPKQVQCSECSLVWCFRCSAPWHENLTCKQFIKGDRLLLKWINQKNEEQWNARKCPKCSSLIQRAGGCPHMTCQSCSCEFCYLCGRRYYQIPFIGQHSNRFSMFGCPYNFYPEKPWLRRTIRGMIATGVVVASPIIVAGAVTAAVTVLPPFGVYRLVRHARARRRANAAANYPIGTPFLIEPDLDDPPVLPLTTFQFDLHGDYGTVNMMRALRQQIGGLSITQILDEEHTEMSENEVDADFPLSVFADMNVEELIAHDDDDKDESNNSPLNFRTCPTTPASAVRKGLSRSLHNLTVTYPPSINRHHSMTTER
ncbi:unnamed protein product [Rotaria magnacalcarata]|uniref:RBR-type E3 ubiquitin transferase n=4 Tax=Rotaria magnacalcarata TaxID=392030 RepID=A0A816GGM7_9BILA|nr:unnamed protein product [Rotaria magnacalcarata]